MQDIHALGGTAGGAGGGGRLFTGSSGGGDRRLRPHNTQNQSLKCPRCDSANTKFCYYNNYNLSQPRHFCKGCRRYWTKGGVLRNVPVGGGCRKAKRSKPKQQPASSEVEADVTSTPDAGNSRHSKENSNSSSESSSLTATTTAAKKTAALVVSSSEDVSATVNSSSSATNLLSFPQSGFFNGGNSFHQHQPLISHDLPTNGQIFSGTGSFTSLMTSPGESSLLGFSMAGVSTYGVQENHHGTVVQDQRSTPMILTRGHEELKMDCGYLDGHSGFGSLHQSRLGIGGLAGMEWQINGEEGGGGGSGDQGLFDFGGGDDQAYLVQNHWPDNDPSLNFPPLV